jgi:predicted DNA-binding protein (MmcQ/YjbR family)
MANAIQKAQDALRAHALTYPGAREDFPWGECVVKVGKKIFVFLGADGAAKQVSLGVKLPVSSDAALDLPYVKPSGYGLGKAGWVSVSVPPGTKPPLALLEAWIDESYRAVAPKKLVKELDARSAGPGGSK